MNQFNIIKIYTVFTQQQDTNSIQVPIDCKPEDTETISRDVKHGAEIPWSKGIEIIQSLFQELFLKASSLWYLAFFNTLIPTYLLRFHVWT